MNRRSFFSAFVGAPVGVAAGLIVTQAAAAPIADHGHLYVLVNGKEKCLCGCPSFHFQDRFSPIPKDHSGPEINFICRATKVCTWCGKERT